LPSATSQKVAKFSLSFRVQPHWRVDETYIRVKGKWVYLYRAVDSSGATIDFLLSAKRDAAAAERFLTKALGRENHPAPRVINTGKYAAYPPAIVELKDDGVLEEKCTHRPVQYLNNVLEQDHRAIKCRVRASQHFRSFWGAWRTIAGYEAIHMIRKRQAYGSAAGAKVGLLPPLHSRSVRWGELNSRSSTQIFASTTNLQHYR
jgi:transposase, IS6 family